MKKTVTGPFSVKPTPLAADEITQGLGAMRMRFDKRFEGPLDAQAVVSMMGILDQGTGSGGYVALERVTGQLGGKRGSFCFQHSCILNRGKPWQQITVIPDTGTDELRGLAGEFTIDIAEDGAHTYTFKYELPEVS